MFRERLALALSIVLMVMELVIGVASAHAETLPSAQIPPASQGAMSRSLCFYVDWDPAAYSSLAAHYQDITILAPQWLHIGSDGMLVRTGTESEGRIRSLLSSVHSSMSIEPIVTDWVPGGSVDATLIASILADSGRREALAASISAEVQKNGWDGVNVDFEGLPSTSRDDFTQFMRSLHSRLHPLGRELSTDIEVSNTVYDCSALATSTDFVVPMLYDEHWTKSAPGAVAGQAWFTAALTKVLQRIPASKVVVGIGGYGYRWTQGSATAVGLTYPSAVALAQQGSRTLDLDPNTLNPTFRDASSQVWLLDAVTAFNQVSAASRQGVGGVALWRLGSEDPAIWHVMHARSTPSSSVARSIGAANRIITYDASSNLITAEHFDPSASPTSGVILDSGATTGQVAVGTPSVPKRIKHGRTFAVRGSLTGAARGQVVIYIDQYRRGRWVSRSRLSASTLMANSYTARARVSAKGRWRVRARFSPEASGASVWSGTRRFTTR
jgi:spore germination protein YaaH